MKTIIIDNKEYTLTPVTKKGGWRLPTIAELTAMYNKETREHIKGFSSYYYWSSTPYTSDNTDAWFVSFYDGYVSNYDTDGNYFVRCVRDTKDGSLELAADSESTFTYDAALTYAARLEAEPELTVKLNGFYYEVI